ncbi:MAG: C4-dicarboxylate-binding protein DctP [Porticoccus sp.]|jgi:C4-dicarboxylate-binding protein DctP
MNNKQQSIPGRSIMTFGKYLLVVLAISGLVSCGSSNSVDEPILIKFPHVTSPITPKGLAADRFKTLVEERLAGRVVVEVYPSGQLMNDDDSIEALAFGEVQMIATSLSKFDRLTNKFQVFDLPFLFPNLDVVEKFQTGTLRETLLGAMSSHGLQGLGFWHNGMKHFTGPVPMSDPDAAKGLKFRIMESDVLQAQILQIGGSPQKMSFVEVYQALQTGAVDAQENTWSNIYSSKFYEVQKHLTVTNHGYVGYLIAVNSSFWDGLPDDIRAELEVIVDEVSAWANQRAKSINEEALNKIIASENSEITYLTAEQLKVWQEKMRPVWDEFSDKIGADLISAAQKTSN